MLAVIESHPVQYHAPVYREVQQRYGIPVTVIYGSDFSVAGYRDAEFGVEFAWDTDLLAGYTSVFLTRSEGTSTDASVLSARGVGAVLRELKPQAVMLVGYGSRFNREACFEAWRTGLPLLFRAETTDHAVARSPVRAWMRDSVLRVLYSRMSRILYIGKRSKAHYERLGVPAEKLVFSPYCVDTTPFLCREANRAQLRAAGRTECRLKDADIAVVFSGKLSRRKGVDVLLAAVKALPEELRRRFCVLLLGDGDMRAQLEATAAAEPVVRVRFLGFRNQTELSRYYHAADALVLPSRTGETWGLVINEALHHGLPCVVADAAGCATDLVTAGMTGYICTAGSIDSLRDAIAQTVALTGRLEVRTRCRASAEAFTTEVAARGVAMAHESVANVSRDPAYASA